MASFYMFLICEASSPWRRKILVPSWYGLALPAVGDQLRLFSPTPGGAARSRLGLALATAPRGERSFPPLKHIFFSTIDKRKQQEEKAHDA